MGLKYAGIGSRETPSEVLQNMTEVAKRLDRLGYTLYSGGADGADEAFERGATKKLIFLPWSGFCNKHVDGKNYVVPPYNEEIVKQFHPAADKLKQGALKLMSRNSYQVLGPDLNSPVDFVVCWTKDGKASGGTGQAMRIAESRNIPIFNLKKPGALYELGRFVVMQAGFI